MTFFEFIYFVVGFWLGWLVGEPIIKAIPAIIREIRDTQWRK